MTDEAYEDNLRKFEQALHSMKTMQNIVEEGQNTVPTITEPVDPAEYKKAIAAHHDNYRAQNLPAALHAVVEALTASFAVLDSKNPNRHDDLMAVLGQHYSHLIEKDEIQEAQEN